MLATFIEISSVSPIIFNALMISLMSFDAYLSPFLWATYNTQLLLMKGGPHACSLLDKSFPHQVQTDLELTTFSSDWSQIPEC